MDIIEIINKKKSGKSLSKQEIDFFVQGVCNGQIKDYQTTSFLMAVCLKGMTSQETTDLTLAMAKSGEVLDLSDVGDCVDKHSTGGVSDTTTLVLVPVLASLGVKVAKMSGRSLGFTGGTADKMEVFEGYNTEIDAETFKKLIKQNGASIVSQSANFAYADKILYKLRSDSATVESKSLIASSIMSKKIACGAKILVLDCKFGSGAFMKTKKDALSLAKLMVQIGKNAGIKTIAVISNMNQPLTNFVGNNFEVFSALQVLKGQKNNLQKVATAIAVEVLLLDGKAKNQTEATKMVENCLQNGSALEKLRQIVTAQGGSDRYIDAPQNLLKTNNHIDVLSEKKGVVSKIETDKIGYISHNLQKKDGILSRQDNVGIILDKMLGDNVKVGDKLATIYYNDCDNIDLLGQELKNCFAIGKKFLPQALIEGVVK